MKTGILRVASAALAGMMLLAGCGSKGNTTSDANGQTTANVQTEAEQIESTGPEVGEATTEIQVFIAASLNDVMNVLAENFTKANPDVKVTFNADSSGTLLQQIEEGFACDIFFSAAQKQMNTLEEDGLVVDGTRVNVVNT